MINDQGTIAPVHADFLIGANPQTGASNREWNSFIDEVAQWDRVLDASEISPILSLRAIGPFPGRNGCLWAVIDPLWDSRQPCSLTPLAIISDFPFFSFAQAVA
jgi:hypothetical protein